MGIPLISSTNEGYQAALSGNLAKKTSEPALRLSHKSPAADIDPEKLGRCARAKAEVWVVEQALNRFPSHSEYVCESFGSGDEEWEGYMRKDLPKSFEMIASRCRELKERLEAALEAIEKNCTQPYRRS